MTAYAVENSSIFDNNPQVTNLPAGRYKVTSISDGDTLSVDMNGKSELLRLIGIDTPEKNHPEKPVQCFAVAATMFLESEIDRAGGYVRLQADPTNDNRDQFNRLLRYVYLDDGTLVNKEILAQGYGFAYTGFPLQKMDELIEAERQARESESGLWSNCEPSIENGRYTTEPVDQTESP